MVLHMRRNGVSGMVHFAMANRRSAKGGETGGERSAVVFRAVAS